MARPEKKKENIKGRACFLEKMLARGQLGSVAYHDVMDIARPPDVHTNPRILVRPSPPGVE